MAAYYLVYSVVWLIAIFDQLVKLTPAQRQFLYYTQVVVLVLFAAGRFETGYDWPTYQAHYESLASGDGFYLSFEPGYVWLATAFSEIGASYVQYTAFLSCIQLLLMASAIRYFFPKYCVLILPVFYSLPDLYLIGVFSLLRQGVAVSLFLHGLRSWARNNIIVSVAFFTLAISFHYSVIICIFVVGLIYVLHPSKRVLVLMFGVSSVFYIFNIDIARGVLGYLVALLGDSKYEVYLSRDVYNASLMYRIVFLLASTISLGAILWVWNKLQALCSHRDLCSHLVFIRLGIAALIVPILLYGFPTITSRFFLFFGIYTIGYSVMTMGVLTARSRYLMVLSLALIMCVPIFRFLTNPLSIVYVPYQSVAFYGEDNSTGLERTNKLLEDLYDLWDK